MEEAVSVVSGPVVLALAESKAAGEDFVPTELLAILNADPNPTSVLNDMDRGNTHFAPVQRDFGFLHISRVTLKPLSSEEQERLTASMRWLRREFTNWNAASDTNCHILAAMFVVTAYFDQRGDFWPAFATSSTVNPEIVAELSKRVSSLQFTPGPSSRSRTPISDKSILDRFNAADRESDWVTVASEWPRFGDHLFPDAFLSQSVCYLQAFARDELRVATDRLKQTVPVMLLLSALSVVDCLALSVASTNPYVRFGSILRLVQQQRRRKESISQSEKTLLTQLLLSVATDEAQWQQWMLALNRYPMRYPQIQRALGHALAQAPDTALEPYATAIQLTTAGAMGRGVVAECLRSFRSVASLDRRKMLWNLAHERWLKWKFGKDEELKEPLMKVGNCELDYAIVGYAVECMTDQQREDKCAALVAELSSINEAWHVSEVAFIGTVNSTLSVFQPYAYARQMTADDEWLIAQDRCFLPFDPQTDRYHSIFFKIRHWYVRR